MKANTTTSKNLFIYHGEVDDPYAMLIYPSVTLEQAKSVGKMNWIETLDGEFRCVGDAYLDELFNQGKIIDGFDREPSTYDLLPIEAKVKYRVQHQHITERMAKELVGEELDISLFKYTFVFQIGENIESSDTGDVRINTYELQIQADSESEARVELVNQIPPIGFIYVSGYNYLRHCSYTETLVSHVINLVKTYRNDGRE
jgi:hypothetical protein